MKRFHVHVHVEDLQASIAFYSRMFAAEPARVEIDYAKWMLDDPRVNFAISTRGGKAGVDHLGIQTDTAEELAALRTQAEAAELSLRDVGETTCCYARSDKHWIVDPQGVAWEQFHTLGAIPVFGERMQALEEPAEACCASSATRGKAVAIPVNAAPGASCC